MSIDVCINHTRVFANTARRQTRFESGYRFENFHLNVLFTFSPFSALARAFFFSLTLSQPLYMYTYVYKFFLFIESPAASGGF